ncbi:MAG TPA: CPBP family intramembrane glutamic endopeptidase [Methylococcaceae bacterium]|jgi:membrane protease YdiL (CAAX protease family)|nr:CPBP family intramembrane glutamic endopeptidase [Methylococcaceae bacterium]
MHHSRLPLLFFAPLVYLLGCLCIAAFLAYPLYFSVAQDVDFHFLVDRGAELVLVLGLFPLGWWLGIGRAELGLAVPPSHILSQMARGFVIGALMLGAHVMVLLLLDIRVIDPGKLIPGRIINVICKSFVLGFIIASIEETVFRGFLLGAIIRKASRAYAVLISAFYFSALHFLHTNLRPESDQVHWYSGFVLLLDAFRQLIQADLDSFLALLTSGIFLACVRFLVASGGLGYCIGLHAGWVFIIKTSKSFSDRMTEPFWTHMASNFDGIIGYLSVAWLSVIIVLLTIRLRRKV